MDFVMLSTADWDNPFWTNKQHVALELAKTGHRVIYINSLGLRQPSINGADLNRILRRLKQFFKKPLWVRNNLVVVSPVVIPFQRYACIRWLNRKLLSMMLWNIKRKMTFRKPLLWTYNPLTTRLMDLKAYQGLVYHCVDEIKAQPGMPVEILESSEEELVRQSDIVFVTAPKLYETRREWNKNVWFFSNVADYTHFSKALDADLTVPAALAQLESPVIGFIGAITAYKLDFALIKYIAEQRPDYQFVFIGNVGEGDPSTNIQELKGISNLHFLGPCAYNELPAALKGINVAILPNVISPYTDNMFPMKFYEYLAAGKPVVATPLLALKGLDEYVYLADGKEQFSQMIDRALSEDSTDRVAKRQKQASEHTYEARTRKMLAIIAEQLDDKTSS